MKSPFTGMPAEEIKKKLAEMRMQIMKLNSELASKAQSKSVGQLRKLRKSIAQASTALSAQSNSEALAALQENKQERDAEKDE